MGFIPRITCRRCGRQYSGIRNRCPYCGTRRVKQSDRVPASTPGATPGTNAARRSAANARWQMIFSGILVAAVILAVIVLISTNLNGEPRATPSPSLPPATTPPTPVVTPSPTPEPTPTVTSVVITYYGTNTPDFTTNVGTETQLQAVAYPLEVNAEFTWTSTDPDVATVDDTGKVTGVSAGTTTITVECYGITASTTVRVKP